jgi:glycerol-3-phosphate dehydrogenase (NAD(P)+)
VTLLVRTTLEAEELHSHREHLRFLPGIPFPNNLKVSSEVVDAISAAQMIIIAAPSDRFRQNVQRIRGHISSGAVVLSATKGLELPSGKRMSQILEEELPAFLHSGICVLSGPNLAKEIILGKPASTVVAGRDPQSVTEVQAILMSNIFRVYTSDDVIGLELAGALKNIVALGSGIGDGLELGDNAKATFITRGLAEITRLGIAAGAQPLTFAGLAGLGDLAATCASHLSRNRYVGEELARGRNWLHISQSMSNVVEGVNTTTAALVIAADLQVEMPIAEVTYRVLFNNISPWEAVMELMERPPRAEW